MIRVGETYRIDHEWKGAFVARVLALHDKWADVEIVGGRTMIYPGSEWYAERGDHILINTSIARFEPAQ